MRQKLLNTESHGTGEKYIDGVKHVWSIFDNAWVTADYWRWVNGKGEKAVEAETTAAS